MLKQIRAAMRNCDMKETFDVFAEIDETCAGGKPGKENKNFDGNGNTIPSDKPKNKQGRGTKKTPAVGVKERNSKQVYAQVMLPNEEGKKLSGKQLISVLDEVCKEGTIVISDDFSGYAILDKKTEKNYIHVSVNHSLGQFSAGNGIDTNDIESFWSLVEREYAGTHHHYSVKHAQNYIDEMSFRQNNRKNPAVFETLLGQTIMKKAA
ncbi:MAG: hypothetical protein Pg6C_20090 [Treponemataceae bacterium]|nr:MAG: hypothetical protein Pg6C_20090 [Treponemataceae bacterium]